MKKFVRINIIDETHNMERLKIEYVGDWRTLYNSAFAILEQIQKDFPDMPPIAQSHADIAVQILRQSLMHVYSWKR
jgi:hypothetical protein